MQWISVEERLPEKGARGHYMVTMQRDDEAPWLDVCFWYGDAFGIDAPAVTAWMPRPEPWQAPLTPEEPEPDGWISVEERLPGLDIPVIACREGEGDSFEAVRGMGVAEWYLCGSRMNLPPTHWQPLPDPPKEPAPPGPFEPRERSICGRILHSICYRGVRQWDVDSAEWAQGECATLNKLWSRDKGRTEDHHAP